MNNKLLIASVISTVALHGGATAHSRSFELSVTRLPDDERIEITVLGLSPNPEEIEMLEKTDKRLVLQIKDEGTRTIVIKSKSIRTKYERVSHDEMDGVISEFQETLPFKIDLHSCTLDFNNGALIMRFDRAKTVTEKVKGMFNRGYNKVAEAAGDARDTVKEVGYKASNAASAVRDKTYEAAGIARHKAEEAGQVVREKASEAQSAARDKAHKAYNASRDIKDDVKVKAERTAANAQANAVDAKKALCRNCGGAMEKVGSLMESAGEKLQSKGSEVKNNNSK